MEQNLDSTISGRQEPSIGISGRVFDTSEPGGAVRVALHHADQLLSRSDSATVYGNGDADDRFPHEQICSSGYYGESAIYGLIWEQTVLNYVARDIDLMYYPTGNCTLGPTTFEKVVCIQGLSSLHGFASGPYRLFRKYMLPRVIKSADRIVTVSSFLKEEIIEHFDVDRDDIRVIYNGIEDDFHTIDAHSVPVDVPDEYILYVGALSALKNVEGLVKAFEMLNERDDFRQKLLLVGPEANATNAGIGDGDLGSDVVRYGYVSSRRKLAGLYANASVFAFPSYYESFGIPPLEAMACGTSVVASDRTALPEVLGDAAVFVNPDEPESIARGIRRVLDNEELRERLVEDGYAHVEQYTWDRAGRELHECLGDWA